MLLATIANKANERLFALNEVKKLINQSINASSYM